MTNFETIQSLTLEELAVFLDGFYDSCDPDKCECFERDCQKCILAWLRKEKDEMKFKDCIRISNAIEKMEEQTMPETKKQKTLMEDFFERCPEARRDEYGNPCACVENIYNNVVPYEKCATSFFGGIACRDCWSLPVPPQRECYKNATVIVEYDKNGDPIISWVRQEDTERIGYEEAMKHVVKVKANE